MTKEKIMEIVEDHTMSSMAVAVDKPVIADELLALIEQEKKEQAREIFEKVCNSFKQRIVYFDHRIYINEIIEQIKNIAKEYGVEL